MINQINILITLMVIITTEPGWLNELGSWIT